MGGYGSGRRCRRETTDDYRRLEVRELHRAGVLTPGWRGGSCWYQRSEKRAEIKLEVFELSMVLRYSATSGGERKDYDYAVGLTWTGCNYGGRRPWLSYLCCGRRAAILYGSVQCSPVATVGGWRTACSASPTPTARSGRPMRSGIA